VVVVKRVTNIICGDGGDKEELLRCPGNGGGVNYKDCDERGGGCYPFSYGVGGDDDDEEVLRCVVVVGGGG